MFCLRERFSQRICDIQIRVYFTNFYVSILNIFTNGVEATLDVPSLLVKPGLLGKCNSSSVVTEEFDWPDALGMTPRSVMNSFTQIASCAASEAAMYSASHVDPATTLCLQLHQLTAPPFKIYTYLVCDLESSRSVSKLASTEPFTTSSSSPP